MRHRMARAACRLPVLLLLLLLLLGVSVFADENEDANVTAVFNEAQFEAALQSAPLVFIKFFHPHCPHCQALSAPYKATAATLSQNGTLRFAQVDVSRRSNQALTQKHSSHGVPTLLLFSHGALAGEFDGAREEASMTAWLRARLAARAAPLLASVSTRTERAAFVKLHDSAGDAVVLAMVAPPAREALDTSLAASATRMRVTTASTPSVAFARVAHPSLLLADSPKARARYTGMADAYAAAPYAVAARTARDVDSEAAQWWFPGVLGGEPLHTFLAVATLPRDGSAVLTTANAAALSSSTRAILYAFGSPSTPDEDTSSTLRELAEVGGDDVVVVYAHDVDFEALAHHVGLPAISDDQRTMPRKTRYVIYRAGTRGAERVVYSADKHGGLREWLSEYVDTHGRRPAVLGRAGVVNTLTNATWDTMFNHDGRITLLLVTRNACPACERAALAMKYAAELLKADARTIIAASYDDSDGLPVPKIAETEVLAIRPYVAVVLPGEKPILVPACTSSSSILAAARHAIKSKTVHSVHGNADSAEFVTVTHLGFLLIVLGVALTVQKHALVKRFLALSRRKGGLPLLSSNNVDRIAPRKFWLRR